MNDLQNTRYKNSIRWNLKRLKLKSMPKWHTMKNAPHTSKTLNILAISFHNFYNIWNGLKITSNLSTDLEILLQKSSVGI